jgi:hypothetical protein
MQIEKNRLYEIILEEYLTEQTISLDEDKARELIDFIKGTGPKPDWYDQGKSVPSPPKVPPTDPNKTYPMDRPAPPGLSADDLAATIGELIHGRDPEEVSEIFQMAFEKLPGVELSSPGDEDYPGEETLYSPGAEGRPVAGFQLEQLLELIRESMEEQEVEEGLLKRVATSMAAKAVGGDAGEAAAGYKNFYDAYVEKYCPDGPKGCPAAMTAKAMIAKDMAKKGGGGMMNKLKGLFKEDANVMEIIQEIIDEGHYRDLEDEGEMYDVLDPAGLAQRSDEELIDLADRAGIEVHRYMDSEGNLIDSAARAELIASLQN